MNTPQFVYPSYCWWASGQFPVYIYYKQCYYKHYCKCLLLNLHMHFFFFFFNWRLITLQYCGFCHTFTWISHGVTHTFLLNMELLAMHTIGCNRDRDFQFSNEIVLIYTPTINVPTFEKQEFQKNICACFVDYDKAFDHVDHNKLWKILKEMAIADHLPASWEICIQIRKQQLELDTKQQTGSK